MTLPIESQGSIFLIMVAVGFLIGLVYDFFRLIRRIFYHTNLLTYIEDFLFWIVTTFIVFYTLLHTNFLVLRFFCFLGIFIGLILYFLCLSKFIINFFLKLVEIIIVPIKFLLNITKPWIIVVNKKNKKLNYRGKIFLQKGKVYGKMKYKATKNFLSMMKNKT